MTERNFNPGSPACEQWEALLADALDGLLKPDDEAAFAAHCAICPACAALYEEARQGREWLEFLSPEPEAPAGLLEKILAQTGPGQTARRKQCFTHRPGFCSSTYRAGLRPGSIRAFWAIYGALPSRA